MSVKGFKVLNGGPHFPAGVLAVQSTLHTCTQVCPHQHKKIRIVADARGRDGCLAPTGRGGDRQLMLGAPRQPYRKGQEKGGLLLGQGVLLGQGGLSREGGLS